MPQAIIQIGTKPNIQTSAHTYMYVTEARESHTATNAADQDTRVPHNATQHLSADVQRSPEKND